MVVPSTLASVFKHLFGVASILFVLLSPVQASAVQTKQLDIIDEFMHDELAYTFYGLASYYNTPTFYLVDDEGFRALPEGRHEVSEGQWLAVARRLDVLLVSSSSHAVFDVSFDDLGVAKNTQPESMDVSVVRKNSLGSVAPELNQIRYAHLWAPLAMLSRGIEYFLVALQVFLGSRGLVIICFAVLVKILFLPVSLMNMSFQRKVSEVQAALSPELARIKKNYDGEEAHNLQMAAFKKEGVSPFYSLKPLIGTFIQIPVMISVFNVLGEMPQLDGASFLWIDNLAFPDSVRQLYFSVPLLGNQLSLLPIVMTMVTVISTMGFRNSISTDEENRKQKRNLYLMAAVFFILFYPFPASMVLYWTLGNGLHMIQQKFLKI